MCVNDGLKELQRRLDDPNSVLYDGDVDVAVNGDEFSVSLRLCFCSKNVVEDIASDLAEFFRVRRGLISEGILS